MAIGEVLEVALRVVVEVVGETVVRGLGYAILKPIRRDTEHEDTACAVVGVIALILLGWGVWTLFSRR